MTLLPQRSPLKKNIRTDGHRASRRCPKSLGSRNSISNCKLFRNARHTYTDDLGFVGSSLSLSPPMCTPGERFKRMNVYGPCAHHRFHRPSRSAAADPYFILQCSYAKLESPPK